MAGPNGPQRSLPPDLVTPEAGDGAGTYDASDVGRAYSEANEATVDRLWWAGGVLYRRRWWILGVTMLVAVASVYLTLQIPNKYRSETRVLLPESGGGSLLAGALSNLSPTAAALIGGSGGGFTRYMAILTSPSTMESVVDRFDLVEAYGLSEEAYPRQAAIGELYERAAFEVSLDFDYLGVSVLDEDPERAAQLANYFVERLNERNIEFQSSSAASNRRFLKTRLDRAYAELDSTQAALQALQERSGVIEPSVQAEALFSSLAAARAEVATAEIAFQTMLSQYGPENPDVQAARAGVEAARQQLGQISGGGEAAMPVPLRGLPRVQREYTALVQEMTVQKAIIETVQPLYEQAALQEQREADAVQVLDPALPPTRKAEPRRSIIVIGATLSAFLVAVAVTLLLAVIRRAGPSVLDRLRAA